MTISELMALNPLSLTVEERSEAVDKIIEYYRARRAQFNLGAKNAGSPKKLNEAVDLEEIGL